MKHQRAGSRRRAALLAAAAAFCALLSAAAASRRDASIDAQLGELRSVAVLERSLKRGTRVSGAVARRAIGTREVPVRFLPPDALGDPALAMGMRLLSDLPAGSYLLASHLRAPSPGQGNAARTQVAAGLRPVEIVVSGGAPPPGSRVDVLAADEPGSTTNPRVRVLARRVELLAISPARGGTADGPSDEGAWLAKLALGRGDAVRVIEADNYAREVRLLER